MARDNSGAECSPCRRTSIEETARRASWIVHDVNGATRAFQAEGLYGVVRHFHCTPEEALEVVLNIGAVPRASKRRQALLRQLVAMEGLSHVDAAEALRISRWTVATYRQQLGIERSSSEPRRSGRRRGDLPC